MSVYVGIDVHRKRSQVAVVGEDGRVQLNRNVVNGSQPMLGLLGGLPPGTPVAFEAGVFRVRVAGLEGDRGVGGPAVQGGAAVDAEQVAVPETVTAGDVVQGCVVR